MGVKMVLSGEGADELFGGYLYFHKAPNPDEFFEETRDKVRPCQSARAVRSRSPCCWSEAHLLLNPACQVLNLHKFDCLRANKSTSAWGIEPRVPFLDADFIELGAWAR